MSSKTLRLNFFQVLSLTLAYLLIVLLHYFVRPEMVPDLIFLLALYFILNFVSYSIIKWLLLFGFLLDVSLNYYFGIHSLSYFLTLLLMSFSLNKIRQMHIWQQTFMVSLMMLIQQVILLISLMICYSVRLHFWFLLAVMLAFIIWPWITLLMAWLRLKLDLYRP